MELSVLEPERNLKTDNFEEALEAASAQFGARIIPVSPTTIDIKETGEIDLGLGGDLGEVRTTRGGIRGWCKSVRIPDPFAQRIPFDLLRTNLRRLLSGLDSLRVVLRQDEPVVIGFLSGTKGVISNEGIINVVIRSMLAGEYAKPEFNFTDSKMVIKALSDVMITPTEGDVSYIGQIIMNSQTGMVYPSSLLHVLRNSCTNSAVLPKGFGQARMRVTAGDNEENALAGFTRKVNGLTMQQAQLSMRYLKMAQVRCPEKIWYANWRGASKIMGSPEDADMAFDCSDEFRKSIKNWVRKDKDNPVDAQDTIVKETYYDIFNRITYGAHHLPELEAKQAMWTLGGRLVSTVMDVHSS